MTILKLVLLSLVLSLGGNFTASAQEPRWDRLAYDHSRWDREQEWREREREREIRYRERCVRHPYECRR